MSMWRVLALFALLGIPALAAPAPVPEKGTELDKKTCRYEVEAVVAPADNLLAATDRLAIYRIRVWTAEKREVSVDLGQDISNGGSFTQPEPDGKLQRAEALLLVRVRPGDKESELEFWIKFKKGAGWSQSSKVPAGTTLDKAVRIEDSAGTLPLGKNKAIGQLLDWKVILSVR
jgi:hypothetical protein